jgi:hypothetical protein
MERKRERDEEKTAEGIEYKAGEEYLSEEAPAAVPEASVADKPAAEEGSEA